MELSGVPATALLTVPLPLGCSSRAAMQPRLQDKSSWPASQILPDSLCTLGSTVRFVLSSQAGVQNSGVSRASWLSSFFSKAAFAFLHGESWLVQAQVPCLLLQVALLLEQSPPPPSVLQQPRPQGMPPARQALEFGLQRRLVAQKGGVEAGFRLERREGGRLGCAWLRGLQPGT